MCSTSGGLHDASGRLRNVAGYRQPSVPSLRSKRTLERIVVAVAGSSHSQLIGPARWGQEMIAWNMWTLVLFNLVTLAKKATGSMANNNRSPDEKQPGENPEGKYHYNPGNMAGKKPGDAEQTDENRTLPSPRKEKPAE
jgi:hypothetical protein